MKSTSIVVLLMITEEEISHQNNNIFDLSHPTACDIARVPCNSSAMVLTNIPCCQVSSSSDTVTHLSSSSPRTRARWPSEVEDGVSSSEDVCSSSSQQSEDQEEEGSVTSTVPL